jgi:hypothetical protein
VQAVKSPARIRARPPCRHAHRQGAGGDAAAPARQRAAGGGRAATRLLGRLGARRPRAAPGGAQPVLQARAWRSRRGADPREHARCSVCQGGFPRAVSDGSKHLAHACRDFGGRRWAVKGRAAVQGGPQLPGHRRPGRPGPGAGGVAGAARRAPPAADQPPRRADGRAGGRAGRAARRRRAGGPARLTGAAHPSLPRLSEGPPLPPCAETEGTPARRWVCVLCYVQRTAGPVTHAQRVKRLALCYDACTGESCWWYGTSSLALLPGQRAPIATGARRRSAP